MLIRFFDEGSSPSQLHLVGFSFGSTVFGIAGRKVILRSNNAYTVDRITGRDPGQIQSLFLPLTGRIGLGDVRFVDTIQTERFTTPMHFQHQHSGTNLFPYFCVNHSGEINPSHITDLPRIAMQHLARFSGKQPSCTDWERGRPNSDDCKKELFPEN